MKKVNAATLALTAALTASACTPVTSTTTIDESTASSLVEEGAATVTGTLTAIQDEALALSIALEESVAADDLRDSWDDLSAALASAITSVDDQGMIDGTELMDEIDTFQNDLDAVETSVEPELVSAWNAFRTQLEAIFS